jgi:hypothetical protein
LRAALYYCFDNSTGILDKLKNIQDASTSNSAFTERRPDDLAQVCKPVQLSGAQVKFESMTPQVLDNGMGGYRIITTTDQYGQASAVFQSAGFDIQHIGSSEIRVFVDHVGENVIQLNKLFVRTEEKTWPWCQSQPLTGGAAEADTNGDRFISDDELLAYIIKWAAGQLGPNGDTKLLEAVQQWLTQL